MIQSYPGGDGTSPFANRYREGRLVEINAHSLFSKYFSESGKLVQKLFQRLGEIIEESDCLVFILIDEVESLTAARKVCLGCCLLRFWIARVS